MKKTSLIPICNAIFNADTIVLTDGEKLLRLNNVFDLDLIHTLQDLKADIDGSQEVRNRQVWDVQLEDDDTEAIKSAVETAMDTKYQHMGVSLWEDSDGYYTPKHTEADNVNASMQVYLPADNCALPNTGSIVYDGIQEYQVPFVPNTGYILSNSNTTVHSSGVPVKPGHVRRSVYFYFKK
jgi:hypothetical protein